MSAVTTIQLSKKAVEELKKTKQYPGQTYSELILELMQVFKAARLRNQHDEFLHKIQQEKMKELWGNKEDDAWETA